MRQTAYINSLRNCPRHEPLGSYAFLKSWRIRRGIETIVLHAPRGPYIQSLMPGRTFLKIVPIPGTTKLHRLDENLGAAAVELTPEDLRDIETASSKITVQGARYPEHVEKLTGHRMLA